MKQVLNSSTEDVMTPERLRKHWFGGKRVPFWNYDPAQLTIGVEIEYFIARVTPSGFELATKNQYLEVIRHLCSDFGYSDHDLKDQPGRVSKDTSNGFIAIKPDFAWHILEIALPPRKLVSDIKTLLEKTFGEVDAALKKVGLERLDMSCLPDVPEKMELVALDRLSGHIDLLKIHGDKNNHAVPLFPSLIAATHIHANIFNEESLAHLPLLYQLEHLVIERFCREQTFRGELSKHHRSKLYESSLGSEYQLRTVPRSIPRAVEDFCKLINESPRLFPNDSFFSTKDLTYIRPTRYGTFEFRSSCSTKEVSEILQIIICRQQQIASAFSDQTFALKVAT